MSIPLVSNVFKGYRIEHCLEMGRQKFLSLYVFYKQLRSGRTTQSCLYFQGFWGSKLLNGCLVF